MSQSVKEKIKTKQYLLEDYIFKRIYSQPELLKAFLRDFANYADRPELLEEIEIISTETILNNYKRNQKEMRADILIYFKNIILDFEGYSILNEEGMYKFENYISRLNGGQLRKTEQHKNVKKIISIVVVDEVEGNIGLEDTWFQRYNFKGESPNYHELPFHTEIFILRLDMLPKVEYYDVDNNLQRYMMLMKETSPKVRLQIAREDKDLMTIAAYPTEVMQDKVLSSAYTFEEKQKTIFYGMGKEDGREEGREERNIEIAKAMLEESDVSYISKVTCLSVEKLEKLKKV